MKGRDVQMIPMASDELVDEYYYTPIQTHKLATFQTIFV